MPTSENDALPSAPWAFGLGLALLIITGAVAAFTAWDRMHRDDLERVTTPTAVGDTHYGKMPSAKGGPLGLKYQGQPLIMISEGKMHDARLLDMATDDSGYYHLYQPAEPDKAGPADHFYLKLEPNDYMEVAPQ